MKRAVSVRRILRPALLGGIISLLPAACAPGYMAPPVSQHLVKLSQSPSAELERGYAIHQAKCAKCHTFEDPAKYEANELRDDIIPEMAHKSRLAATDEKAVLTYLLAARKLPPPTVTP